MKSTQFFSRACIQGNLLTRPMMLVVVAVCFSNIGTSVAKAVGTLPRVLVDGRQVPEIEWDTTVNRFRYDNDKFIGQRLTVHCPPLPPGTDLKGLYGTDRYPSESSICIAALHAGKITTDGGLVTIQINPGQSEYKGSERNGVKSSSLPGTSRSIAFIDKKVSKEDQAIMEKHAQRIQWDTRFTRTGLAYRDLIGQRFTFRVPAAPANLRPRLVYGTDQYDFSSMIAPAAKHAGVITEKGGLVTLEINEGVTKLVGSIRNDVETSSKGRCDRSITFVKSGETK
ncbi:MAG: LCCL domain-containing protein [Planctomycetota bacterium]